MTHNDNGKISKRLLFMDYNDDGKISKRLLSMIHNIIVKLRETW